MDNDIHIKSKDLCERCEYSYFLHCFERGCNRCCGCEMEGGDKCKCIAIQVGTPCPYFKEA